MIEWGPVKMEDGAQVLQLFYRASWTTHQAGPLTLGRSGTPWFPSPAPLLSPQFCPVLFSLSWAILGYPVRCLQCVQCVRGVLAFGWAPSLPVALGKRDRLNLTVFRLVGSEGLLADTNKKLTDRRRLLQG